MKTELKDVYIAPHGSVFPAESVTKEIAITDFRDVVFATTEDHDRAVCMVSGNLEMLRLVIKYSDYFGIRIVALEGIPGGNYDMLWDQTIYPLDRESFQVMNAEQRNKPVNAPTEAAQIRKHIVGFEHAHKPAHGTSAPDPRSWEDDNGE